MLSRISNTWRAAVAKVFVAVMVLLAVAIIPTYTAQAAKAPTLSKKSVNILVKGSYDLNIKNKIKGSTYVWTSSNEKIATVNKSGLVKGKSRGDVVITCTVKTPDKKEIVLTSKVKVIAGAKEFAIKNKVSVLLKGQTYDLNRTLTPFTSNDVTTWTSSDTSIAKPDKNGKFTALKVGTVTITGTTVSGQSDSVTIKIYDEDGSVATQAELEELLKAKVSKITLRTNNSVTFTIPEGNYKNVTLAVDAPNADVYNNGVFKAVEIYQVAPSTYHENAKGNKLIIRSFSASIEVSKDASVSIEITAAGAKVTIKNSNGEITGIVMMSAADLKIEGESKNPIPVEIKAEGAKVTTSVPLDVTASAKANLTLEKGAEKTTIAVDKKENVPTITGDVTISVTVGTGSTQEKVDVKGTPITGTTPTPSAPITGGGGGGGGGTDTPVNAPYTVTRVDGKTRYTLNRPITSISRVKINYIAEISVDGDMLAVLLRFLDDTDSHSKWLASNEVTRTYGIAGNEYVIHASAASGDSRTITLVTTPMGLFDGREYTVTLNTINLAQKTGSFTIRGGNKYITVSKVSSNVLDVETDISGLTFTPEF